MREMEFYYRKPRPEILAPMLQAFERGGQLANAGKRMFTGAFLGALYRNGSIDLADLARQMPNAGRQIRIALAWAARLAGRGESDALIGNLLDQNDASAAAQIRKSPSPLTAWQPGWEKTALSMYWGAFMATGENIWLDAIIDTALGHARGLPGGREAAASLYDYAPRHAAIAKRLRARQLRAGEKNIAETILKHAQGE